VTVTCVCVLWVDLPLRVVTCVVMVRVVVVPLSDVVLCVELAERDEEVGPT
jgi:hypothetical protein